MLTLKSLLRCAAPYVPPRMRHPFVYEVEALGHKSPVPKSVILALIAGIALWFAVGSALSPVLGDGAVFVGAAAGFMVLYPYFFVVFQRARRTAGGENAAIRQWP